MKTLFEMDNLKPITDESNVDEGLRLSSLEVTD